MKPIWYLNPGDKFFHEGELHVKVTLGGNPELDLQSSDIHYAALLEGRKTGHIVGFDKSIRVNTESDQ